MGPPVSQTKELPELDLTASQKVFISNPDFLATIMASPAAMMLTAHNRLENTLGIMAVPKGPVYKTFWKLAFIIGLN